MDKQRTRFLLEHGENLVRAVLAGDTRLADQIIEGPVIRGITASDFHVFEDGKEQTIQNAAYEPSLYWDVRDNMGHHTEYLGPGGGTWSTAEWPINVVGNADPPHYLIAYGPPESPDGSCHQIKISVNRPNALIASRNEYCKSKHPASDPLSGTKLGEELERGLAAPKDNSIDLSLLATVLYSSSDSARIHIALDWPWESLRGKSRAKGVLGEVVKKDGSLALRFSDLADREGVPDSEWAQWRPGHGERSGTNLIENRYDAQVELPPGEYELRVALGDGTRFGQAKIPLSVDSHDGRELGISTISLCKHISDVSANSHKLPGAWDSKLSDGYLPLVSNETEFKPTSNTRFKIGEVLYVYFEIYDPLGDGNPHATVQFQIRILDLNAGKLISDPESISATPYLKVGSPIIHVGRGIDISKVPRGTYRLDVRASDSRGKTTGWRSATFTVE
jgi:hypothetical protein